MKNKLILICSDEIEGTTDEVCKWLNHFNKKYIRISKNNVIEITSINISKTNSEIFFKIDDTELKLSDISSYWYRRSYLNFKKIPLTYFEFDNENITNEISQFLLSEQEKIYDFFHNKLNKKSKLNTFQDNYINKIKVLDEARKLKIQIPKTLITDDLLKLISFGILFSNNKLFLITLFEKYKSSFISLINGDILVLWSE